MATRTTAEIERKTIRLQLKKTLEAKWEQVRWITKHLDHNETELCDMLRDLKEQEESKLERFKKNSKIEERNQRKKCCQLGREK